MVSRSSCLKGIETHAWPMKTNMTMWHHMFADIEQSTLTQGGLRFDRSSKLLRENDQVLGWEVNVVQR